MASRAELEELFAAPAEEAPPVQDKREELRRLFEEGGTTEDVQNLDTPADSMPQPEAPLHLSTAQREVDRTSTEAEMPGFWSAVKDRTAEVAGMNAEGFWNTLGRVTYGNAAEMLTGFPKAAYGVAEEGVAMATGLYGALIGGLTATAETIDEAWIKGNDEKSFGQLFAENLPERVFENMEIFGFVPRTESGKAVHGMVGMALGEFARAQENWADRVYKYSVERGAPPEQAAALATANRIMGDALLMLGGLRLGKGKVEQVQGAVNNAASKFATGKGWDVFDATLMEKHKAGGGPIRSQLAQAQISLKLLYKKKSPSALDRARIEALERQVDKLKLGERAASGEGRVVMNPKEILEMASEKDLVAMKERVLLDNLNGKTNKEPIIIEEINGKPKVVSGLEAASTAGILGLKEVPVQIVSKSMDTSGIEALAGQVNKVYQKSRTEAVRLQKELTKPFISRVGEVLWDKQYDMKRRLVEAAPESGLAAVRQYEFIAGASAAAKGMAERAIGDIYTGLSRERVHLLDELINARRQIQIDAVREAQGKGPLKREGNLTQAHFRAKIDQMRSELGPAKYKMLDDKATKYFDYNKELLRLMHEEGLLTTKSYNRMKELDYQQVEYLDLIDPPAETLTNKLVSVRESGVRYMRGGKRVVTNLNSRELFMDHLMATYSRVFKNRANRELANVARETKGQPGAFVRKVSQEQAKHLPNTEVPIYVYNKGKKTALAVDKRFAEGWIAATPEMRTFQTNLLKWAVGTPIVKATAVGYNPTFFLTDFPRNITHLWIAASKSANGTRLYSPELISKNYQLLTDFGSVFMDAVQRKGRYKDFVESGGAPSFLAHIGRDEGILEGRLGGFSIENPTHVRRMAKALGWFNETSEIITRLMVRERALKQGMPKSAANYEGRRLIDFAQSGRATKTLDHVIPFLNPAVQALRTSARGVKQDPLNAALASLEVAGLAGLTYFLNWQTNREGVRNLTDDQIASGLNVFLPEQFNMYDPVEQDFKQPYIPIKMDNVARVASSVGTLMMRQYLEGTPPSKALTKSLMDLAIVDQTSAFPLYLDMILKYWYNLDTFTGGQSYPGGTRLEGPAQYFGQHDSRMTPRYFVDLAEMLNTEFDTTGFSPHGMQAMVDSALTSHGFNYIAQKLLDRAMYGQPDIDRFTANWQAVQDMPDVRRVLRFASSSARDHDRISERTGKESTQQEIRNKTVEQFVAQKQHGDVTEKQFQTWLQGINEGGPAERERLAKKYVVEDIFNKVLATKKQLPNMPTKGWWLRTGYMNGTDRARAYYDKLESFEVARPTKKDKARVAAQKAEMRRISAMLASPKLNIAYWDKAFTYELERLNKERGR